MRKPLNKRLPRELRANAGKYICLFLMFTITIMIGSSFLAVLESAVACLENDQREALVEDGQFETMAALTEGVMDEIEDQGVDLFDEAYATVTSYQGNAKILVFGERTDCNIPSVFEGALPKTEGEIALDRLFAANRGIELNDEVTFDGVSYTVSALISLPDYNSLFKDNQDLVMNTKDFGVAVTTNEGRDRLNWPKSGDNMEAGAMQLEARDSMEAGAMQPEVGDSMEEGAMQPEIGDSLTHRYVYRFHDRNLKQIEQQDIEKEIQKVLLGAQMPLQSFLPQRSNQSISFLVEDMGTDGPLMTVFIYLLIGIIAFVFAILTDNTIEAESGIIGTLRASGYKKSEIIAHYMAPTVYIAVIGSLTGNLLGYTLMPEPFRNLYYSTYCMPPMVIEFSLKAFLLTNLLPVVIMLLLNYVMLYDKLSLSPLRFLRRDLNKRHQKKAVKLPNLPFLHRFRMRVIIQNKGSFFILFLGIFLSSFLLMFGLGLSPLMDHYVDSIDDSLNYEYQYILKTPVEAEGGEQLEFYGLKTWYPLGKKNITVNFMGIGENSTFFSEEQLPEGKNEIVATATLAKKMGIKVGEDMIFKDEYRDKEYTLKVVGISDYEGTMGAFMSQKNLNELLEQDENFYNCYVSDEKLDIEKAYIAKFITRADMLGAAAQMMDSFGAVISFIKVFSVAIYMMLIYLLTKTVIEKNALSISFMKVFGYNNKEVGKLYLNATTITVMMSLIICIPLEILGFRATLIVLSSLIEGYMEYYAPNWLFVTIVGIGAAAYLVINALHVRRVRKIPMSEALKNRE